MQNFKCRVYFNLRTEKRCTLSENPRESRVMFFIKYVLTSQKVGISLLHASFISVMRTAKRTLTEHVQAVHLASGAAVDTHAFCNLVKRQQVFAWCNNPKCETFFAKRSCWQHLSSSYYLCLKYSRRQFKRSSSRTVLVLNLADSSTIHFHFKIIMKCIREALLNIVF